MFDNRKILFYNNKWCCKGGHREKGKLKLSVIKAKTLDRKIAFISAPELVSGDENLNIFTVLLDSSWQFANAEYFINFFTTDEKEGIIKKLDVQNSLGVCTVPNKTLEKYGNFSFGIFAQTPDGTVKTSAVTQYRIQKGIETLASGRDNISLLTLKNQFIKLINSNTNGSLLSAEMDFENEIDPTFTNYMSDLHSVVSDYSSFLEAEYLLIQQYINPDFERMNDSAFAPLIYYIVLSEYLRNSVSQASFDSVSDELDVSNGQIEQLQAQLEQKEQITDNIKSIYENFYIGVETNGNT